MFVDKCIKGQPISPAGGEVAHINIRIACGFHLAPQQQGILGWLGLCAICLFNGDVLDLVK